MKTKKGKGLMLLGSLRADGITAYLKQGRVILRSSTSIEKRSNTFGQFVQRQKMRHAVALWRMLKYSEPMFTERSTAYSNFMSLANHLPVVYVERRQMDDTSFLMPGIPVSDGKLPPISERLEEVDGAIAIVTDLKVDVRMSGTKLRLYTAVQTDGDSRPRVRFSVREVSWNEMSLENSHYVLKGEEFADPMMGWALVLVKGKSCSPQTIITRCTLYQRFTSEDALQSAIKSYGGLTPPII